MSLLSLMATLGLDTSKYEDGIDQSKNKISSFGSVLKFGLATAGKVAVATVGAVTGATVAAGTAITNATNKVAAYGDSIDKMSQKMGISAEAYQEWDAVMQHSGTSISVLKPSMRTLAVQAQKNSSAFQKLGISQEEVASLSQEDLFAKVITGLQDMEEGAERTALTSQLLGRGATELGALLNTSSEDTQKMRDRVHELNGVMSDEAVKASAKYTDSMQDMRTAMDGLTRNAVAEFLPSMTSIVDGLTSIFAGEKGGTKKITEGVNGVIDKVGEIAPKLLSTVGKVASAVGDAISDNFPRITSAIVNGIINLGGIIASSAPTVIKAAKSILTTVVSTLSSNLGSLDSSPMVSTGVEMIKSIGEGLVKGIPTFLQNALPMVLSFSEFLRAKAGLLIDAGLGFIQNLVQGIINSLPLLIEYIPQIITNIAGIINDNAPKVLMTGANIIMNLAKGIIDNIPVLVANLPQILQAIWAVFMAFNWLNLGKNIITFITNGVKSLATTIPTALQDIGSKALEWVGTMQWSTLGADIIDLILIGIESLGTMIPTALANIGSFAVTTFKSIDWFAVGKTAISLIVTAVTGAGRLIGSALASAGKKGLQAFKKTDWKGVGKAAITFVANALKGGAGLVLNALRTAGKNAFNAFKNINWLSLGKNIVTGVVRGITGAAGKIATAAKEAAKNALKKAKNFLGIKSPSRVFRDQVGKNIALGLALGISQNEKYVSDAVDGLNRAVMDVGVAGADYIGDTGVDPYSTWQDIKTIDMGPNASGKNVTFNNYVTVNGAENPEDWAMRFAERLRMEVRMA